MDSRRSITGLASLLDIEDWAGAFRLGLATCAGFPVVPLTGSLIWEGVAWKLGAIHSGIGW